VARVAGPVPARTAALDEFPETGDTVGDIMRASIRSFAHIIVRTIPWILLGIWFSMMIANRIPIETFASGGPKVDRDRRGDAAADHPRFFRDTPGPVAARRRRFRWSGRRGADSRSGY